MVGGEDPKKDLFLWIVAARAPHSQTRSRLGTGTLLGVTHHLWALPPRGVASSGGARCRSCRSITLGGEGARALPDP